MIEPANAGARAIVKALFPTALQIPHGVLVPHERCGELAAVWAYRYPEDDLLCVACSCGTDPYRLAAELGVPLDQLDPIEHRYILATAMLEASEAAA
jgi:hypothetical protein